METTEQRTPDGGWTWLTPIGDRVRIYEDDAGDWRWRVRARNGENVGSGEGHPRVEDALAGAMRYHAPEHPSSFDSDLLALRIPGAESPWVRPLPTGELETTWPAAWFGWNTAEPADGTEILVDGVRHVVTARRPGGQPDRIVVRLARAEARHA